MPTTRSASALSVQGMSPEQVMERLNTHLRTQIFQLCFHRLTFEHVKEIEYYFHTHLPGNNIHVTKVVLWFSNDRDPMASTTIFFDESMSKMMGCWIEDMVDPSIRSCGILGFSQTQSTGIARILICECCILLRCRQITLACDNLCSVQH